MRASIVQFWPSLYIISPNRTSELKDMTDWISRELMLFNYERLGILGPRIGHPCEKLWQFEFLESFRCSILSVSVYYVPESDIRVKSYDHLNFYKASVVQFWVSWYIMCLSRTSEWKVMTIGISRELLSLNFERVGILCPWIEHPC